MSRFNNIEIHKEQFTFSAAHFTIFSETEREPLHGHNYYVGVKFKVNITQNGMAFDYRHYKTKILALCKKLNLYTLLPAQSPYLQLREEGDYWIAEFNQQKIPFLKQDVIILPLTNITIEELSHWFLQEIVADQVELAEHAISKITVKVHNGNVYGASSTWRVGNAS